MAWLSQIQADPTNLLKLWMVGKDLALLGNIDELTLTHVDRVFNIRTSWICRKDAIGHATSCLEVGKCHT